MPDLKQPDSGSSGKSNQTRSVTVSSESIGLTYSGKRKTSGSSTLPLSRKLNSSLVDSPVNHSALPASAEARLMTVTSGQRCLESLEGVSPLSSWSRTFLDSLLTTPAWSSNVCILTWKLRATKLPRRLYFRLLPLGPSTEGIGSGFVPTLDTIGKMPNSGSHKTNGPKSLIQALRLLPTLTARDWKTADPMLREKRPEKNGGNLPDVVGGEMNPRWLEWFMGLPTGWTQLKG